MLDNASYHSGFVQKIPTMNTLKADMIAFMKSNNITIPNLLPIKTVLLDLIKKKNIEKEFVINKMAEEAGHMVLRLPTYHNDFNLIESVWSEPKRKG